MTNSITVSTHTLSVPGAELAYDVHGELADATAERPTLLIVGTPMGAEGSSPWPAPSPTAR